MTLLQDTEPRTYFRSFESALADFRPPAENLERIREVVDQLAFEHVFIPESRAFIGLEPRDGASPVAYVAHGYIAVHPAEGDNYWVELPANALAAKGFAEVAKAVEEAAAPTCGTCFINLPSTGVCGYCD